MPPPPPIRMPETTPLRLIRPHESFDVEAGPGYNRRPVTWELTVPDGGPKICMCDTLYDAKIITPTMAKFVNQLFGAMHIDERAAPLTTMPGFEKWKVFPAPQAWRWWVAGHGQSDRTNASEGAMAIATTGTWMAETQPEKRCSGLIILEQDINGVHTRLFLRYNGNRWGVGRRA